MQNVIKNKTKKLLKNYYLRWNSQPSLRMAQVQEKAMMIYKSALRICKWWFNALRKKKESFLDQEQVGRLWMQLFS